MHKWNKRLQTFKCDSEVDDGNLIEHFRKELRVTERRREEKLEIAVVFYFSFIDLHNNLVTTHDRTTL